MRKPLPVLLFLTTTAAQVACASAKPGSSAAEAFRQTSSATAIEPSRGLFQVILNVRDMERQVRFYRDVMGFRVVLPEGPADFSREHFVRLDTGGGAYLALHAGRDTDHQQGEARISVMTSDVHVARAALLARGIPIGEVRNPAPGVLVADGRDPEGNVFHLESRVPPESAPGAPVGGGTPVATLEN